MCVREVERENKWEREREGGGGKLYAHGNLVPLRKKGGLGEVCFLLDLENLSLSPFLSPCLSLALHQSVPLSLCFIVSFCEDFYHFCEDRKKGDGEGTDLLSHS